MRHVRLRQIRFARTRSLAGLLLFGIAAVGLDAQTSTGSIAGTVTDPNSAVVPGVKIVATHEPTKRTFDATATDSGLYVLPSLPVGPYSLSAEHPGFKKLIRSNI